MDNGVFKHLYARLLSNRVNLKKDLGQARLRHYFTAGVGVYFLTLYLAGGADNGNLLLLASAAGVYLAGAWLVLLWVSRRPRSFLARRLITITNDGIGVAVCLFFAGHYAVPLLSLYFWITIVNGLRFGAKYLIYAGLTSLVCLYAVFWLSAYWKTQSLLVYPVFLGLLVLTTAACFIQRRKLVVQNDSEHDQALIRIIITSMFMIYLTVLWHLNAGTGIDFSSLVYVASAVVLISIAIFLVISFKPGASPLRRVLGMVVDLGAATYGLIYGGEYGVPMLAVFLWVSMGNGFRYGPRYLYGATVLSLLGFSLAVATVPFWTEHLFVAVTFLIVLSALPLYMVSLIRRLNSAISSANDANRAKTQFLANMSHELRTPLNAVIGVSDLLIDANVNDYQRKLAGRIQSSAQLLLGMIERILDISKIETGRIELRYETFDLYVLLRDVAAVFEVQAEQKGLEFKVLVSPDTPVFIRGDAGRLKQILVNLTGNACKFTERGYVRLHVYTQPDDLDRPQLRFDIHDSGIGIAEERQSRIFEPFVQADDSVTRRYGGTGLGMSISRQLVEAMDGQIGLRSREHEGSTFSVQIPLLADKEDTAGHSLQVSGVVLALLDRGRRLQSLGDQLSVWGYKAFRFETPAELTAWLSGRTRRFSVLVLVDENDLLPEVSDLVRTSAYGAGPALVHWGVFSEHSDPDTVLQYADQGLEWTFGKPVANDELHAAVHFISLKNQPERNIVSLADYYANKQGKRLKILVAEDNVINKTVINELLLKVGHDVVLVDDGEQALDALDRGHFDLALLDLNMPKLGGLDVIKTCRFRADLRSLPIIILSADATVDTRNASRAAGADGFVTKPLDVKHLLDCVARLENGKKDDFQSRQVADNAAQRRPESAEILNPEVIDQFKSSGIENTFFRGLFDQFSSQGEQQLNSMRRAIARGDNRQLKDQLHRLKGGAAYFGASRLVAVCDEIERTIANCRTDEQRRLVGRVEELFHKSCVAVSRSINIEAAD